MNKTAIEYLDFTWNPLAMRCTPVSQACTNCWHLAMADRLAVNPTLPTGTRLAYAGKRAPLLIQKRLTAPLRRKKPAIIGVQFMGDLFHEDLPTHYIADVWNVMRQCPQHTFQVLTKRPYQMMSILSDWDTILPNVWLGVTAENQAAADERIPLLLQTPAVVRFLSCEPLLGAVDLRSWLGGSDGEPDGRTDDTHCVRCGEVWGEGHECPPGFGPSLSWVIVGGESGPGARPMKPQWARDIVTQCKAAGVPVFVKQMGTIWAKYYEPDGDWHTTVKQRGDTKGAMMQYWPENLRVRELPQGRNLS